MRDLVGVVLELEGKIIVMQRKWMKRCKPVIARAKPSKRTVALDFGPILT